MHLIASQKYVKTWLVFDIELRPELRFFDAVLPPAKRDPAHPRPAVKSKHTAF